MKQFAVLSVAGAGSLVLNGCPIVGPLYGPGIPINYDPQDEAGNLFIQNISMFPLVLYNKDMKLKVINEFSMSYRVHVIRLDNEVSELRIFQHVDAADYNFDPPISEVSKRWLVNLPSQISDDPNYIWLIDNSDVKDCGELIFYYHSSQEIFVDVRIILRRGGNNHAKWQVTPGIPLHFGLSYGEFTIEYTYWRGKYPKAGDRIELGKITTEIVDGEEVPITVNLNAENRKIERSIPNWEG